MGRMRFKPNRIIVGIAIALVLYLLLKKRSYEHEITVIIPKVSPMIVWEFVADFSNMKRLNPTM